VERSQRLNVTSIIAIIEQLKYFGVMPVFISTEAVFDGKKGGYTETDPARPILTYGLQKREVECHLENGRQKYLVVRLARVFGPDHGDGTLFTSWLERIARGGVIRCASDQVFSPIHVDEACEGILRLIKKGCEGTFHLSGIDSMSRCSMLEMLIRFYEKYMPAKVEVEKCGINDFPVLEKRPLDVSMKPNKFVAHTSLALSSLEQHCGEITKAYFAR
jgi:dTDP-4-dehydrorhamnose reductase